MCTVFIYNVYTNTHTYSIYFENIYMYIDLIYIYIYIYLNPLNSPNRPKSCTKMFMLHLHSIPYMVSAHIWSHLKV